MQKKCFQLMLRHLKRCTGVSWRIPWAVCGAVLHWWHCVCGTNLEYISIMYFHFNSWRLLPSVLQSFAYCFLAVRLCLAWILYTSSDLSHTVVGIQNVLKGPLILCQVEFFLWFYFLFQASVSCCLAVSVLILPLGT